MLSRSFSLFILFHSNFFQMANKKATCYILNVAHSMSSDFPKALSTLTENIEDKVRVPSQITTVTRIDKMNPGS
jgi:hypothetical protein